MMLAAMGPIMPKVTTPTTGANPYASMAYASLATGILGTIGSAYGAYAQSRSVASSLQFQSDINAINAGVAEKSAQTAILAGQREEQNLRLKQGQVRSRARTAYASRGVDLGSRSAQEVMNSSDLIAENDALTINANTVRNAWAIRGQAVNATNQSIIDGAAASDASPLAASMAPLLSGASGVAKDWYMFNKFGML